jgi:lipopolysaccharide heptosyltransferase II
MTARLRLLILQTIAWLSKPFINQERLSSPGEPCRILIIRPDHIGDVLFTTPALRALRCAAPDAHITYMVGSWAYEVVKNNPHLSEIIICPFPGFTRRPKKHLLQPYTLLWRYARSLRSKSFDVALTLRFDHWWGAMLAYWAGVPQRIGYALPEMRPFLTKAVPYVGGRHEVEQNLHLVMATLGDDIEHPGPLEFRPEPEHVKSALNHLPGKNGDRRYLCLHPGTRAPVKLWRPESFAQVADTLAKRYDLQVIISGSAGERNLAEDIAGQMESNPVVIAGQTSLGQLAAIMGRCELVIGVDSGPLHLAVSQGVPTVHLFGPVDHRTFGPWGDPRRHLVLLSDRDCIPCNRLDYAPGELEEHSCVRSITVTQVLKAADSLLSGNSQLGL